MAEALTAALRKMKPNFEFGAHHGSLSKEVRITGEKKFKNGEYKALICTSSLELGIDVGLVDLVIQFGSPRQVTRLIQRAGRAGHGINKKSKAIIIGNSADDCLESLMIADEIIKKEKIEENLPFELPFDVIVTQIAGIALEYKEISKLRLYNIIRRS